MRRRKKTITQLKKQCWKIFSEYIRRRDSDVNGNCFCITCGVQKPWKEMQAGHFIAGRNNSILFDEEQVHTQCYRCNIPLGGNHGEYMLKMLDMYGRNRIEEMRIKSRQTLQFKQRELKDLIVIYTRLIKQL